jgi:hypothetical protein
MCDRLLTQAVAGFAQAAEIAPQRIDFIHQPRMHGFGKPYEYIYNELAPAELAERFPTLGAEQIYATILYYLNNRERMNTYLSAWLEHGRRMREEQARNPTPAMLKLRRIKDELKAA